MQTKSQTLVGQLGDRVTASAERYRQGRRTLLRIQGTSTEAQFQELKDADLTLDGNHGETDVAAKKKLAMIGSGRGARALMNAPGTSRRVKSWIWTAQGVQAPGEEHLHNCELIFFLILGQLFASNGAVCVHGKYGGKWRSYW